MLGDEAAPAISDQELFVTPADLPTDPAAELARGYGGGAVSHDVLAAATVAFALRQGVAPSSGGSTEVAVVGFLIGAVPGLREQLIRIAGDDTIARRDADFAGREIDSARRRAVLDAERAILGGNE